MTIKLHALIKYTNRGNVVIAVSKTPDKCIKKLKDIHMWEDVNFKRQICHDGIIIYDESKKLHYKLTTWTVSSSGDGCDKLYTVSYRTKRIGVIKEDIYSYHTSYDKADAFINNTVWPGTRHIICKGIDKRIFIAISKEKNPLSYDTSIIVLREYNIE